MWKLCLIPQLQNVAPFEDYNASVLIQMTLCFQTFETKDCRASQCVKQCVKQCSVRKWKHRWKGGEKDLCLPFFKRIFNCQRYDCLNVGVIFNCQRYDCLNVGVLYLYDVVYMWYGMCVLHCLLLRGPLSCRITKIGQGARHTLSIK